MPEIGQFVIDPRMDGRVHLSTHEPVLLKPLEWVVDLTVSVQCVDEVVARPAGDRKSSR